jgi:deazaflavin-dependent oxidoreductase (nitroreductase family)
VLVLAVPGRRTGRLREVPLAYLEVDGGWLVCGGAGGQSRVDWVANLRAAGTAQVTLDRVRVPVVATEPSGEDRVRLRALVLRAAPRVRNYERRARREAPLFVLRPVDPPPA